MDGATGNTTTAVLSPLSAAVSQYTQAGDYLEMAILENADVRHVVLVGRRKSSVLAFNAVAERWRTVQRRNKDN